MLSYIASYTNSEAKEFPLPSLIAYPWFWRIHPHYQSLWHTIGSWVYTYRVSSTFPLLVQSTILQLISIPQLLEILNCMT